MHPHCPLGSEHCTDCDDWNLIWCEPCYRHHPPQMPHGLTRLGGTECPKIWGSHACCLATDHPDECLCECGVYAEPGQAEIDLCDCGQPYMFPTCHLRKER